MSTTKISQKAVDLILQFEGVNQPGKWPGGDSGITIGIGYDLGYHTVDQFESDWGEILEADQRKRLKQVVSVRGIAAKNRAPSLADIVITAAIAKQVFQNKMLPCCQQHTMSAFPGLDKLHLDVQGALISLVLNRGTSMVDTKDSDRQEMRAIRDAVTRQDVPEIAKQLRLMKRLWEHKNLEGLLRRREAEAQLVQSTFRS
jgi:GH24 family phage-related lysozyme (muramidase)